VVVVDRDESEGSRDGGPEKEGLVSVGAPVRTRGVDVPRETVRIAEAHDGPRARRRVY